MKKRVVIIGSRFAGYTAALELSRLLKNKHEIIVIDKRADFVFTPYLVWYPFGLRKDEEVIFKTRPVYKKAGITFIEATVFGFDLENRLVYTQKEDIPYDYLLIAAGAERDYSNIKGFSNNENAHSILNLEEAQRTKIAWEKFLKNPGPAVIGAAQGAAYFSLAYEFLFNVHYQLKKLNLLEKAPLSFVSSEPFLTHLGIGGLENVREVFEKMFDEMGVKRYMNAEVKEIKAKEVVLFSGEHIPSNFTMIIPRYIGHTMIRATRGLGDENGFIEVNDEYRHVNYPEIYAAGKAVHIPPISETPVACGAPKSCYPSELMARIAAHNIAADIEGGEHTKLPFSAIHAYYLMDSINLDTDIFGETADVENHLDFILPSPHAIWAKGAFEKYFTETHNVG